MDNAFVFKVSRIFTELSAVSCWLILLGDVNLGASNSLKWGPV